MPHVRRGDSDGAHTQVVMGAWEEKTGAVGSQYDVLRDRRLGLDVQVYAGVLREECAGLMRTFLKHAARSRGSKLLGILSKFFVFPHKSLVM